MVDSEGLDLGLELCNLLGILAIFVLIEDWFILGQFRLSSAFSTEDSEG
jgi:hypothetical protein